MSISMNSKTDWDTDVETVSPTFRVIVAGLPSVVIVPRAHTSVLSMGSDCAAASTTLQNIMIPLILQA